MMRVSSRATAALVVAAVALAATSAPAVSAAASTLLVGPHGVPAGLVGQRMVSLESAAAATREYNARAEARGEKKISCTECQLIMGTVIKMAGNATTLRDLEAALGWGCDLLLPGAGNKTARALCSGIANITVGTLVPWVDKQLLDLAWDVPLGFCSVFVPVCTQPCCDAAKPTAPEQLHLSLTNATSSEMAVTWVTLENTATSTVQWGTSNSAAGLTNSADGKANDRNYSSGGWVGSIHSAVMTGLKPATTYYYRVGDASGGWSDIVSFNTLPANAGTAARPLRVLQVGDMGYADASNQTIATITAEVEKGTVDLLLHVGDVGYADGFESHADVFFRKIQPFASRVPVMLTPGNHEIWFDFESYRQRTFMPGVGSAKDKMYYSFDYGSVHWAMMNTESPIDTPDITKDQVAWLEADLAAANAPAARATHPWVVAAGHRPFYCSNPGNKVQCTTFAGILRNLAESALVSNAVDLGIQCHEHSMEATYPVSKSVPTSTNYTDPTAPVYVVNGAAGNREGNEEPSGQQPWSAWHSREFGFGRVTVAGPGSLTYEFVAANGTSLHSVELVKTTGL